MQDDNGVYSVFHFDTRHRVWHEENGMAFLGAGWHGELYALEERGRGGQVHRGTIWILGDPVDQSRYEEFVSVVEFADLVEGTGRTKSVSRLVLRLEIEADTTIDVSIRYDSRGEWLKLRTLQGELIKGQTEAIVPIRRCDHYRIRLEGWSISGQGWTLHSLTRERRVGSNKR